MFQTKASHATNDATILDNNEYNQQTYPILIPKPITTLSKSDLLPKKLNNKSQIIQYTRAQIIGCYKNKDTSKENLCFHIS